MNTEKADRILRPKEVCTILGISRTSLWRKEKAGELPKKKRVSAGAVGWMKSDIDRLMQEDLDYNQEEAVK